VTAVSVGAVLRAHNLDEGPKRVLQSSYGFLRTEPYEPEEYPEHSNATPFTSEMDGDLYVQTINYFIKKVSCSPKVYSMSEPLFFSGRLYSIQRGVWSYSNIPHILGSWERFGMWGDSLCVGHGNWVSLHSGTPKEQRYVEFWNLENKFGLKFDGLGLVHEAGKITTDMTWLVEDKKPPLKPIHRCPTNKNKRFYKVEYDLFAIVEGRNLRYEARYTDPADPKAGPQVQKARQVSIASAFQPGTQ